MRLRLHVPSMSPFLWAKTLIFLMITLMGRMGVQPILPIQVTISIDIILNFDWHGECDVACKRTFNIKNTTRGSGGAGDNQFFLEENLSNELRRRRSEIGKVLQTNLSRCEPFPVFKCLRVEAATFPTRRINSGRVEQSTRLHLMM